MPFFPAHLMTKYREIKATMPNPFAIKKKSQAERLRPPVDIPRGWRFLILHTRKRPLSIDNGLVVEN